jgi:hypothetical protein
MRFSPSRRLEGEGMVNGVAFNPGSTIFEDVASLKGLEI